MREGEILTSSSTEKWLVRAAWIVAGLLVVTVVGFGIFYYLDRYVHANQPRVERETEQLESAVRQDPQNASLRVAVAQRYLDQGSLDRALKQAQEALKIDDQHQGAYAILGRVYLLKGNLPEAESNFRKLIALNQDNQYARLSPALQYAHYQLGQIAMKRADYATAADEFRASLQIQASDADAHLALALALQQQGQHDEAIRELDEALRFVPDFTEVYEALATSYTAKGMVTEARYARAMVLLTKGEYQRAATELADVVKVKPDLAGAQLGLGLSYEQLGKRDEAIAALQQVLALRPGDVAAIQALGRLGVQP